MSAARTHAALAALVVLGLASCVPRGPNVVLISIDSLRHDSVDADVAPVMARFRDDGLTFTQAVSPAPWTTPAMMSVMTGLPAPAHGVDEHDRVLAAGVVTLAERFRDAGWQTWGFIPEVTLRSEFGFARGFELFDESRHGHHGLSSPDMFGKLMHAIDSREEGPFFAWAHPWDPHYNYTPPEDLARRFEKGVRPPSEDVQCLKWTRGAVDDAGAEWLRGRQDAEIRYTDRYVGELLALLDAQGIADETIVVLVADHGEAFGEHGWLGHTNRVDEAVVHVPLMIRGPGVPRGVVVERPVSTAWIGRTVLRLAGLDDGGFGLGGPLPLSEADAVRDPVLSETRRRGCVTSIREGSHKLVLEHDSCRTRLFDVEADPLERRDLREGLPEVVDRMTSALRDALTEIDGAGIPPAEALDATSAPQIDDALRSLGYLPGSPSAPDAVPDAVGDPCSAAGGAVPRDSFGDAVVVAPCPPGGARRCIGEGS